MKDNSEEGYILKMTMCARCAAPLPEGVTIKNPHSAHKEFCSEECARLNRVAYCHEAMHIFVLNGDDAARGVYGSEEQLKLGVAYWMQERPTEILSYEEWVCGYPQEPEEWGWCYIPYGSDLQKLQAGGSAYIPKYSFWGTNLVGVDWEPMSHEEFDG